MVRDGNAQRKHEGLLLLWVLSCGGAVASCCGGLTQNLCVQRLPPALSVKLHPREHLPIQQWILRGYLPRNGIHHVKQIPACDGSIPVGPVIMRGLTFSWKKKKGRGNGSWFAFTFLLGQQKLPLLQRQQAEQKAPNSHLVGKQAAFKAWTVLFWSMKLIKTRVVGQCQRPVPSE